MSIPTRVGELDVGQESIELVDTPFYSQDKFQCGPASLATALSSSGVTVDLQELVDRIYLPGRQGSLQVEMLAATRTSGRIAYVIDGTLQVLWEELAAGRPVVILQNLGVAAIPRWHFAVVVGIDAEHDTVILRSGVDRRRVTSLTTFLRTWRRSDYWGFVVLRPDELPTSIVQQRYLKALAAFEVAGRSEEVAIAWQTALLVWPKNPVALFGLGNARLAAGDYVAAEGHFRVILEQDPVSVAAHNNLAIALARQARFDEARNEIGTALDNNNDPVLEKELWHTEGLIEEMSRSMNGRIKTKY